MTDTRGKMGSADPLAQINGSASVGHDAQLKSAGSGGRVDCAVVIVTYNSAHDIISLLEALPAAAAGITLRTIIVDNGSTDSTIDLVRDRCDVSCIEAGANLGYSGGINVGRRHAGDFSALLVLNPDVVLEPGALYAMFAAFSDPGIGIVAPMLLDDDGNLYHSLRREPTVARAIGDGLLGNKLHRRPGWLSDIVRDESSYSHCHAVDWASGAALLISAACDRAVGPWDERFFLYSEDTDYAARARAAGFRIEYLPTARVRHRGGGSGQSSALTALMAISRIRYVEKDRAYPWPYRLSVIMCEALRSRDPGHRTALKAVLNRSKWPALMIGLLNPPGGAPRSDPEACSSEGLR
jgi:GT2 family glycosyltransferase